MASQVDVVNRGLFKLGALPIMSMADGNKQARVMSGLWDTVLKAELRRAQWSFAMRRAALPALAAVPAWGFNFTYQLPSDCLRVVQVNDFYDPPSAQNYRNSDDSPYTIEGSTLLTDYGAPLKIRYVANITDPGAFDALFVEVLASKLAYEACESITQSNQKKDVAAQDYTAAKKDAVRVGALEKPPQGIYDDAWVTERL